MSTTSTSTAASYASAASPAKIARRGIAHGSGLGTKRWVVEHGFVWLHQFQRLRTRYEHRADLHLALLHLACALICWRKLPAQPF